MIIIYDIATKNILQVENNVMIPTLPKTENETISEKRVIYQSEGRDFIGVPYEIDYHVFNFDLCFDAVGNFVGM